MNAAAKPEPPHRAAGLARFWVLLISTVVLAGVLFLIVRLGGYVEGEEFSPTHFRSRTFTFYEIPLIHWQITPIRRDTSTPMTALTLTQKNLITPPPGEPTLWHLVSLKNGGGEPVHDDAALLMKQLRYHAGGDSYWKTWTNDHPEMAKELWPTIGKLAERELYILLPRLFEIVRQSENPATLRSLVRGYLQEEYKSLIRDMRDAGQDDLADALAAEAASDLTPLPPT
ncbi:hypothetical protein [Neorhodopirellula pilleata]|uniref:Uncharacterized protein n=1 Tax=Neorhodopirellula pilleata TaxID=2714738 RepID=A0A5C6AX55_9BACT|nr:hypothetical protein [Neorhodopirellula pilleata]TWU03739.1 hypothetical protein Pla100_06690 [Neorhodopirellula pilleata]